VKIIQPTGQLFGRTLKNIKLPDFELSEGAYRPGLVTPRHSHEWALLCVVLKGSYFEKGGLGRYRRGPSTVFFHPPDEPHVSDFSDALAGIFQIEIRPRRLAQLGRVFGAFERPMNFEGGREFQLGLKIYREFKWMDEASPIAIEGLTLELLAAASRSHRDKTNHHKTPGWLKSATDFLHDSFSERYSLDRVAAEVGVHPKHLAAEFRRRHRQTIGEYLRRLRVEHARRELEDSEHTLAEIALASGFHSQSHFSRTFKLLTGFTPAQYRKTARR
jgi:AraC family transcriptional regulator